MIKEITLAVNSELKLDFGRTNGLFYSLFPLDYKGLPPQTEFITIKGAESFLREDLYKIVRVVSFACPKAEIKIETTGFSPLVIKKQIIKIVQFRKDIGLRVILDGFGKTHDEISGIKGGYGLVLETIRNLKELGLKNLEIGFGLVDQNISHLKKVYRLSRELGVGFSIELKSELKQKSRARKELSWLVSQEIKGFSVKRWAKAYFAFGLVKFLKDKKRILPDYCGLNSLFINSFGVIYPSETRLLEIGKFQKVSDWPQFCQRIEKIMSPKKTPVAWTDSTAQYTIKKHWIKVGWWVCRRKFLYFEHLRQIMSLLKLQFFYGSRG